MRTNNKRAVTALTATALASLAVVGAVSAQATENLSSTPAAATTQSHPSLAPGQLVSAEQRKVYIFTAPARLRTGPSTNRTVTGLGYPGQKAISDRNIYTARGESVTCRDGYPVNFWYLVRNATTGLTGWVSRCWIRSAYQPA